MWNRAAYMEVAVNAQYVLRGPIELGFVIPTVQINDSIMEYHEKIAGRYTALEMFARISDFVAGLSQGSNTRYMLMMNRFILGAGGTRQAAVAGPYTRAVDSAVLNLFGSSGFAANDGGNQVNHFWYSVALTVAWGPWIAQKGAELHENNDPRLCKITQGASGCGKGTQMDLELSYQAIDLGKLINSNSIRLYQIGDWLRYNLSP